jgi:hypothetical protein
MTQEIARTVDQNLKNSIKLRKLNITMNLIKLEKLLDENFPIITQEI